MQQLGPGEPRRIGRYRVLAELGQGGMGRVLLGVSQDGRVVALKQVHPGFAADERFRSRFRREVETSRMVSGAYTAAVMDADPDADIPWLASVFVAGPSLREAVDAAGGLPESSLRLLAVGLASALAEIHRVGLIHRDLKPSNVLLADDGPRVIDFGIARAAGAASELTHTGSVIGSPGFMSPEQAEGLPVTTASDVFSLGALLVMAATGQGPFTGDSTPQTLYNVVHAEPALDGLPPGIARLVAFCLAKDPRARPTPDQILDFLGPVPPTAKAWPPAVHALIAQQQDSVSAALFAPVPEESAPPRDRRSVLALLSVAIVVVLGTALSAAFAGGIDQRAVPADSAGSVQERLQAIDLEQLRQVDPCPLLESGYLATLGEVRGSMPLGWSGCETSVAVDENADPVSFAVGLDNLGSSEWKPTTDRMYGLTLVRLVRGEDCLMGALIADQPGLGIYAQRWDGGEQACAQARELLDAALRRLAGNVPMHQRQPGSLIAWDPCTIDEASGFATALAARAGQEIAREAQPPHACRWSGSEGTARVDVSLDRSFDTAEAERVDIAGKPAYQSALNEYSCRIEVVRRQPDQEHTELVTVSASTYRSKPVEREVLCASARELATVVVSNLPAA